VSNEPVTYTKRNLWHVVRCMKMQVNAVKRNKL